jgi:hypothetical protein
MKRIRLVYRYSISKNEKLEEGFYFSKSSFLNLNPS